MAEKTIAIRIDEDLHRKIKIRLAQTGMTLKDYIVQLICNDLSEAAQENISSALMDNRIDVQSIEAAQRILDFMRSIVNENME